MRNLTTKLTDRAAMLGEARVREARQEVKAALIAEVPDHIAVEEEGEALVISGRNLGRNISDNSSLRDVAFLMRGVK